MNPFIVAIVGVLGLAASLGTSASDLESHTERLYTPLQGVAPLSGTVTQTMAGASLDSILADLPSTVLSSERLGEFHITMTEAEAPVEEVIETIEGQAVQVAPPLFYRIQAVEHPAYKGFLTAMQADEFAAGVLEDESAAHEIQLAIERGPDGGFVATLDDYAVAQPGPEPIASTPFASSALCVDYEGDCVPPDELRHQDSLQVEADQATAASIKVKVYYDLSFKNRFGSPTTQINNYFASSNDKIFEDETPYKLTASITSTNKNHHATSTDGSTNWNEFRTDYINNEASWKTQAQNYNGERFKLLFTGFSEAGVGGEARIADAGNNPCDYWTSEGSNDEDYCGHLVMYTGGETASYHGTVQNMGYVLSHEMIHSLVYYHYPDGGLHDNDSKKKESDGSICSGKITSRNIMYYKLATSGCDHIHGWATTEQECYIQVGAEYAMDFYPQAIL